MTADRIAELEMRNAFQDDTIAALNDAIVNQQRQIDLLRRELKALREQILQVGPHEPGSLLQEIPPHY